LARELSRQVCERCVRAESCHDNPVPPVPCLIQVGEKEEGAPIGGEAVALPCCDEVFEWLCVQPRRLRSEPDVVLAAPVTQRRIEVIGDCETQANTGSRAISPGQQPGCKPVGHYGRNRSESASGLCFISRIKTGRRNALKVDRLLRSMTRQTEDALSVDRRL
jgi:hypothetical protein